MKSKLCLIAPISLVLIGCAARVEMGKMKVVNESGSKEDWVKSDKDYFERDNKIYLRAMVTDCKDLSYEKQETNTEANELPRCKHRVIPLIK